MMPPITVIVHVYTITRNQTRTACQFIAKILQRNTSFANAWQPHLSVALFDLKKGMCENFGSPCG